MSQFKHWFSNMLPISQPFVVQGVTYRTVENFYQAMKTPKDAIELRTKIAAMNPFEAKRFARTVKLRDNWEKIKLEVMDYGLHKKWKLPQEGTLLLSRRLTHDLIELNDWHDNFWGSCVCPRCGDKGLNHLGRLIALIGCELQNDLATKRILEDIERRKKRTR